MAYFNLLPNEWEDQNSQNDYSSMKQSEKLDRMLRWLYQVRNDREYHQYKEVMERAGIVDKNWQIEGERLAKRLVADRNAETDAPYVMRIRISSHGIDYVEESSYSHPGKPIIQMNFNISGNQNAINVGDSNTVSQDNSITTAVEALEQLLRGIKHSNEIPEKDREELIEHVGEVQVQQQAGQPSKRNLTALLQRASQFASIGSFVLNAAKTFGLEIA